MGGYGSGERFSKKAVVEGRLTIDTADLRRWNLLAPGTTYRTGSLYWRRGEEKEPSLSVGYALDLDGGGGTFWLRYQTGQPPESVNYPVRLVTTPCHLGGVRWWFTCPLSRNGAACRRRVRKVLPAGPVLRLPALPRPDLPEPPGE
jgi:hypothetical protein